MRRSIVIVLLSTALSLTSVACAHDSLHPELNGWMMALKNKQGGSCCDGSDAIHLRDVDWVTQNKDNSHFKVRIPTDAVGFTQAAQGKEVATTWVDVPDDKVVTDPNKDGATLVWPVYGYLGPSVTCFLPGTMG